MVVTHSNYSEKNMPEFMIDFGMSQLTAKNVTYALAV